MWVVAVWLSGNTLISINVVALAMPGTVSTVHEYTILVSNQATQAYSA